MKLPILTLVLALFATLAPAQQTDSLRAVIARMEASQQHVAPDSIDLLKTYQALARIYANKLLKDNTTDSLFAVYDQMEVAAHRQNNARYQAIAIEGKLTALMNLRQYDKAIAEGPATLKRIEQLGQWRNYYSAYSLLVAAYRLKGDLDRALQSAGQMHDFAREHHNPAGMGMALYSMARVYNAQRRFDRQEESLHQAIVLLQDSTHYLGNLANVYFYLGTCLIAQERYDDALQIATQSEEVNRRYEEATNSRQTSAWNNTFMLYTDIYRQSGQFDMAEVYLNKLDSLTGKNIPRYLERGHILYGKGRYKEAMEMLDKHLATYPHSMNAMDLKFMTLIELIPDDRKQIQESYDMHRHIASHIDSMHNQRHSAEVDEIRTQYEVERHIAEKARNRMYYLFASGLCLLLVLLLAIAVYHNRAIRAKNRRLYQQIKEADAARQSLDAAGHHSPIPTLQGGGAFQHELVHRLRQYLLTDGNLTRSDINRDDITTALGTNRNILSEAVKTVTGRTLMEYIRSMQLEDARHRLDNEPALTVEAIVMESGMNINTFYRLFKKYYGMSPAEYRRLGRQT